ncbi:RTA1 like protein-domain-containing protein [Boletus reticuloceps]|uniref:RTA1 like protein-domain-containing protein n=1 Tax=Boletus reticuloceps TaxID=495285 RepID=A0A8I2YHB3_9AGAM|nr:RTA1 like protein-domain-containing protein [Boletus reticuloceps]
MEYPRLLCLVFLISAAAAQATSTATSTPSATSSPTLVQQGYSYNPSTAAAGIFAVLYAIASVVIFFRLSANRTWWGLCLPIGAAVMSAGFALRIAMTIYPNSLPIYLCSALFILLAPAAFLAFDYILYGRFVVNCIQRRHSLIRPERTARYFVVSDITSFLVLGTGGSLLGSTDPNTDKIGIYIVIGGLALQTLSFGLYILLVYYAYRSLKRNGIKPFEQPWGKIMKLLFFSSAFFLLRCIYRTIEVAQGLGNGYLADHEAFFYVFDSLPLLIGISTYAVYWPSRYLRPSFNTPSDEMSAIDPPETRYQA